jgi:hypothetical protein
VRRRRWPVRSLGPPKLNCPSISMAAAVLGGAGGRSASAHLVAARSDEFCRVLAPVLSATNSRKASDEHRDVGRRHPDRLRRVWLWPCCHSYRRHHPAPGNRSSHYRNRRRMGGEGFAAVDYDRRGRGRSRDTAPWSLDRDVEDVDALIEATGDPRPSTPAPLAQPSRSPRSSPASQSRRSPSTSRPTSPVLMAASTSPRSSECWTRASTTEPAATT